ncbi:ABC transporter permease [Candidatus Dojkabacteria bacterium]|uniref:ABC transporter permease n=1 Tax=Candidatus Dojkabacteria bacterium TaxID=2099670 RepID=A0A955L3Q4_9BACT|nr:ABC transporter permease [Candidatus Dojkabacteria bacterium]
MKPKYILQIATRGLSRRKLRTALTAFAVFIGVFLILLMVSASLGGKEIILGQLTGQLDLTNILVGKQGSLAGMNFTNVNTGTKDEVVKNVTPETQAEIEQIDHVVETVPMILASQSSLELVNDDLKFNALIGAGLDPFDLPKYVKKVEAGEEGNPLPGEIILAGQLVESSGKTPEYFIGKTMILKPDTSSFFAAKQKNVGIEKEFIVKSVADIGQDKAAYFLSPADAIDYNKELGGFASDAEYLSEIGYDQLLVNVDEVKNAQPVADQIKDMGYEAITVDNLLDLFDNIFLIIQVVFSMFGVIALAVAAIGIANTMVMSVYERTKEIGIWKAIGAKRSDVRKIFLTEAAIIGFLGGITGVIVTLILTYVLNIVVIKVFLNDPALGIERVFVTPIGLVLGVLFFATIVGMLAGIYPASKASKLNPIEALSYE